MGQYFKAINLDKKQYIFPHDYGNGLKLMEHSWLMNPMMNAITQALAPGGAWHRNRLVWAGDYMDEGLFMDGLEGKKADDQTLYDCCRGEDEGSPCIQKVLYTIGDGPVPFLIVNHDTREFVSLKGLPEEEPSETGWHIHPLSLLTCSGNGRGGGDFRGTNAYTGSWAGHNISAEYVIPEGYQELRPDFTERKN